MGQKNLPNADLREIRGLGDWIDPFSPFFFTPPPLLSTLCRLALSQIRLRLKTIPQSPQSQISQWKETGCAREAEAQRRAHAERWESERRATPETSYDKALFLLASQATFMPRRRAMLPIHDVRAASNPAWMGAFGVLRLRMHPRKFLT